MKLKFIAVIIATLAIFALCFSCVFAEGAAIESIPVEKSTAQSDAEVLQKSQNPVSNLISVPFEYDSGYGNNVRNVSAWVKPVIPMVLNDKWNLIARALINYQGLNIDNSTFKSFGNSTVTLFLSPRKPASFMWGAGPAVQVPMANTSAIGSNALGLGPEAVGVYMKGPWLVGLLANNIWSVGGGTSRINQALFQPFINYNLPQSWFISTAPQITADWTAKAGSQWTVPMGIGFGKMVKMGKQPVVLSVFGYKNIKRPDTAFDYQLQFVMKFLFPE